MTKGRPLTPTIVIFVLLIAGLYFIWTGVSSPAKLKFLGFEMDTSSVGLVLVVLAVALLVYLVSVARKGQPIVLRK